MNLLTPALIQRPRLARHPLVAAGVALTLLAAILPIRADEATPPDPPALRASSSGEALLTYTNSLDGSIQRAALFVPAARDATERRPLLVVAHYWGGNEFTARAGGYYEECARRGWILLCPRLHGQRTDHRTALASLESQHDIIDAIAAVGAVLPIDRSRIYLVGRSMGGMTAEVMAAKYPELFAAVVAGQGISDLAAWVTSTAKFREGVEAECGPFVPTNRFEYARRSAISYACNLAYVPIILWHGGNDTWVPPEQSERLWHAVHAIDPRLPPVFWLRGASHCEPNVTPDWECDQLRFYRNVSESEMKSPTRFFPALTLVTDEDKSFFWLDLRRRDAQRFGRVQVAIDKRKLTLTAENLAEVAVDLGTLAAGAAFDRYAFASDGPARFRVHRNGTNLLDRTVNRKARGPFLPPQVSP